MSSRDVFIRVPLTQAEQEALAQVCPGAMVGPWLRQEVLVALADFIVVQEICETVSRTSLPPDTKNDWCFRAGPELLVALDEARGYAPRGRWVRAAVLRMVR